MSAFADSGVGGYIAGGPASILTIQKFSFPSDSTANIAASLSQQQYNSEGCAASGTSGYIVAGDNTSSAIANVNKIAFPAETLSATTAMQVAIDKTTAVSNELTLA
jgi:hypothetical protein